MKRATPPVLLIAFNRPDTTRRVFDALRRARPSRLYVAADGWRDDKPGENHARIRDRRYYVNGVERPFGNPAAIVFLDDEESKLLRAALRMEGLLPFAALEAADHGYQLAIESAQEFVTDPNDGALKPKETPR